MRCIGEGIDITRIQRNGFARAFGGDHESGQDPRNARQLQRCASLCLPP